VTPRQAPGGRAVVPGFRSLAPDSWKVSHDARSATVKPGGDEPTLASVTALKLRPRYAPRLYAKVSKELDSVTSSLADKLNGKVIARRDVVASGIRSRQYELAYEKDGEGLVDRITFVLKGKDEYYVLCRWLADRGEPEACSLLLRTFSTR